MIVELPNPAARLTIKVEIPDTCPVCGGARSQTVYQDWHYLNGKRILADAWDNPCGHKENYEMVLLREGTPVPPQTQTLFEYSIQKALHELNKLKQPL